MAAGGTAIPGTRSIPVLAAKFSNTGADPYATANLQRELFDGPWPTGTMTQYYQEISYGQFTVNGTVFPWKALAGNDAGLTTLQLWGNGAPFHTVECGDAKSCSASVRWSTRASSTRTSRI